jgi:lysophospholipase L1-like esterase
MPNYYQEDCTSRFLLRNTCYEKNALHPAILNHDFPSSNDGFFWQPNIDSISDPARLLSIPGRCAVFRQGRRTGGFAKPGWPGERERADRETTSLHRRRFNRSALVGKELSQNWLGPGHQQFFNPDQVVFHNEARGGTSSKSYYNIFWAKTLKKVRAGDFVFIQFGINDKNMNPDRHTEPMTDLKDYLAKYVKETRAKGAYPVLITPMQSNHQPVPGGSWGLYPEAMRRSAAALAAPLIDLDAASAALRSSVDTNYSTQFIYMNLPPGAYSNYPAGNVDDTHLQAMGANEMSKLVVQGIRNLSSDANLGRLIPAIKPAHKIIFTSNEPSCLVTRSDDFPAGLEITAKALPGPGFKFVGWSGDLTGTNAITIFLMGTAEKIIGANFSPTSGNQGRVSNAARHSLGSIASINNNLSAPLTSNCHGSRLVSEPPA